MTSAEGQRLADALAKDPAVKTIGGWELQQDDRTGAICYYSDKTGESVWCSPGWEAEGDVPPFLSIQTMSGEGELLESKDQPFDGTPADFLKVMQSYLETR